MKLWEAYKRQIDCTTPQHILVAAAYSRSSMKQHNTVCTSKRPTGRVHQLACIPLPRLDYDREYHPLTIHERGGHWVKQNASNKIPSRSEFTMVDLEADHCRTGLTPRRAEGTGVQHPLCSTTFRLAGRGGTWGTPRAPASGQNRAELHGR